VQHAVRVAQEQVAHHAEVIELEGIGHMGPITHPGVVRDLLLRHADGVLHGL
jgi:pimeloyl-ACP methyl ester carboxylesterase